MSTTLPVNIEFDKWKQGFKIVSGCEPGTFKFIYEQECCDTSGNSIFDNKEFDGRICSGQQVFMTLSADCQTVVPMTLAQIMALINTDEKVKVTSADPCPKYLADSFQPGQYIQFVQGTNGQCQVLIPQLDLNAITANLNVHSLAGGVPSAQSCGTTAPVALTPGNVLLPSEIPYNYHVYRNGSNLNEVIECSPYYNVHMRKFRGQLWLLSDQTRTITTGTEPLFYLSPTSIPQLNSQGWTQRNVPFTQGWMRHRITGVNGYLQMLTAGDAEVTFQINYEVNKGLHAVRFGILVLFPNGNLIPITQAKEGQASAPRYAGANPAGWTLQDKYGNHTSTLIQGYGGSSIFQFSMGRAQQFFVANGSARGHFPQNTIFVPFCRPSTMMTGDTDASSVPGILSIYGLASGSSGSQAIMQGGMYYDVKCIDDDHDRRYWIKEYNL